MKLVSLITVLLLASSAQARDIEECEGWKEKANLFMNWRQQGVPVAEAVKETAGNISRGLLLRAYATPRETDFQMQYRIIDEFSEQIYQECLAEQNADASRR
ncbi:hypothetical protein [Methylophaga sp.]|jgi:hypothetical protein|uniref:hypothetical protein n=1 Tax=Methylophaga sp. TaxID=2024840 RepID=UPI0014009C3A|nr:hypothetical protein [Methylophaga sp.]MTI63516.1 hypothetical protein [Methylophaga sp.]